MLLRWLFCFLVLAVPGFAQGGAPETPVTPQANGDGTLLGFFSARTPYEFWLTVMIAVTGVLIIGMLMRTLRVIPGIQPSDVTRPVIVVTVVVATLILITAGYSNTQIAPAFGLFGTIVGYVLGRLSGPQPSPETDMQQGKQGDATKPKTDTDLKKGDVK